MPAISFFADGRDAQLRVDRLNADPEIAFIVPDGPLDPEVAYFNRLKASLGDRTEGVFYGPFDVADHSAVILNHLRGPGPHVRGCFVLDLLLSKDR